MDTNVTQTALPGPDALTPGVPGWLLKYPRLSALDTQRARRHPPRALVAEVGGEVADTFGWDTVFAIPIPDVNSAIVAHKSSPSGFAYQDAANQVTCQGTFGDWQICQGGDGSNIRLTMPVSALSGSYAFSGAATPFSYPGTMTLIVQIKLKFIPHTPDGAPSDPTAGTPFHLVVRGESEDPSTDPVASVVATEWPGGDPSPGMAKYVIEYALGNWFNENLGVFAHVFAVANLNRYIDKGQWAFCNPSYVSYAYIDRDTLADSVLGVLCMTGGRTTSTNIQELTPYAIPSGSRAGFLVSRQRFLADLVLPVLPLKWPQASTSQFQISSDGSALSLIKGQSIRLPDVSAHGGTYTPKLKGFTLAVQDSTVRFDTYTEVDLGLGVTGWCRTTHWYTVTLAKGSNGQTLQYTEVQPATMAQGTTQSEGTQVFEWMLLVVGIVATVVLGVLTEGAAFAVGGLILGLLLGAAASAPEIEDLIDKNVAPSIDLLSFNATNPITWSGSSAFQLDFAGLNGSLQLGGNPGF